MRLMAIFDTKSINKKCNNPDCSEKATRASVYKDNINPWWWCENCRPDDLGILYGRIQMIETYLDALNFVKNYCKDRTPDYRSLIKVFAQAKRLPERMTEAAVQEWFNGIIIF